MQTVHKKQGIMRCKILSDNTKAVHAAQYNMLLVDAMSIEMSSFWALFYHISLTQVLRLISLSEINSANHIDELSENTKDVCNQQIQYY